MDILPIGLNDSLTEAIQKWMDGHCEEAAWDKLDTYIAENTARLMAVAASQVLLSQASLSEHLRGDGHDV